MTAHQHMPAEDVPTHGDVWAFPLSEAVSGNRGLLAELLRTGNGDVPEYVRIFLADVLDGQILKPVGRPEKRTGAKQRAILVYYFAALEVEKQVKPFKNRENTTTPKERALAATAKKFGVTRGAVKRIVENASKIKITYEWWVKQGRPQLP